MTDIRIVEQLVTLKIATAQAVNLLDVSTVNPADMTSGSATSGQVLTADGVGGIDWDSPSGGVDGPGSSTDNALPRWDGTGGDTLKNSGVTLSDSGAMVFPAGGSISKPGSGANSEAFGAGATSAGAYGTAVGINSQVSSGGGAGVAIGNAAKSLANDAVVIGNNGETGVNSTAAIAVGSFVDNFAPNAIAIGNNARIRQPSSGFNEGAIAIGRRATIGDTALTDCQKSIAIGFLAEVTGGVTNGMGLGPSTTVNHNDGVAIGRSAVTTAANRCTIGTIGGAVDKELQIGLGFAAFGATPPGSQPSKINDPSGGTTVDAEARSAIAAIIDALEGCGITSAT